MVPASETLFWICFCIVFYTYAGYPLLLVLLVFIKKMIHPATRHDQKGYMPVTLVVAAYNEEDIIEDKIRNSISLDYPADKIKFIFITDGSNDNTAAIVKKFPVIQHLHLGERRGKLAAINRVMPYVKTEIVIFSDANTIMNRECITKIIAHYHDAKVGGVAGEKKIVPETEGVARGEGMYWKYESALKKLDSELYTTVGAAGELFSMRTALFTPLPDTIIIEDFVQSLSLCAKGYVVRYEPGAYTMEKASISENDEMERKIRIAAGGFQAIIFLKDLLNVFRHPVLSFQYISHRVLRWTVCPIALIGLFITSMIVWKDRNDLFFTCFLFLQTLFYLMAFAGWMITRKNRIPRLFYLPYYFVFMNMCVFAGFARFIEGKQHSIWIKALRSKI
ncbi:MAG TPA: glycosyltransferase family 2 protein [Flavitalea sp.]|nr:glycosyltransferase family 2 protein [Flavitalea sp.]